MSLWDDWANPETHAALWQWVASLFPAATSVGDRDGSKDLGGHGSTMDAVSTHNTIGPKSPKSPCSIATSTPAGAATARNPVACACCGLSFVGDIPGTATYVEYRHTIAAVPLVELLGLLLSGCLLLPSVFCLLDACCRRLPFVNPNVRWKRGLLGTGAHQHNTCAARTHLHTHAGIG